MCTHPDLQRDTERLAALGGLLREILHEVKNRLFAIHSGLQLLRMELPASGEADETLDILFEESARLEEFLRQLRLLHPSIRPRRERVAPGELIKRLRPRARGDAGAAIRFPEESGSRDLPEISADPEMALTALDNLLRNALEASNGTPVSVWSRCDPEGCRLWIHVSDVGPGMDEAVRARAFEPFYSTKGGRTGIGLTVARRIMEDHGGSVEIRAGENGGTVASLVFPLEGSGHAG